MKVGISRVKLLFILVIGCLCVIGCCAQPMEEPQPGMMNPIPGEERIDPELMNLQMIPGQIINENPEGKPQGEFQEQPQDSMYGKGGSILGGSPGTYILITGVKGTCTAASHKNWNDVMSYAFHAGENPEDEKIFGEEHLTITKQVDSATPAIFNTFKSGGQISTVWMEIAGTNNILAAVVVKNARITGYSSTGDAAQIPIETITFTSGDVTWNVPQISSEGIQK